jgi:hypothetical protein
VFFSDTDISFRILFTITVQNLKETDNLLSLGIDGRIIPKSSLKKLIHLVQYRGQEVGENCIMRSFIACTLLQV